MTSTAETPPSSAHARTSICPWVSPWVRGLGGRVMSPGSAGSRPSASSFAPAPRPPQRPATAVPSARRTGAAPAELRSHAAATAAHWAHTASSCTTSARSSASARPRPVPPRTTPGRCQGSPSRLLRSRSVPVINWLINWLRLPCWRRASGRLGRRGVVPAPPAGPRRGAGRRRRAVRQGRSRRGIPPPPAPSPILGHRSPIPADTAPHHPRIASCPSSSRDTVRTDRTAADRPCGRAGDPPRCRPVGSCRRLTMRRGLGCSRPAACADSRPPRGGLPRGP